MIGTSASPPGPDLPRRLEAVHDRHQRIQQHQLRAPLDEQRHGLLTIFRSDNLVPLRTICASNRRSAAPSSATSTVNACSAGMSALS